MNVEKFWKDVLNQDEEALKNYFHRDAIIKWPCTNEIFTVNEYIKANCEYPGSWDGEIKKIIQIDNEIISVVKVYPRTGEESHHVVSFIKLHDGLIIDLEEYWSDDGNPPEWRLAMNLGKALY